LLLDWIGWVQGDGFTLPKTSRNPVFGVLARALGSEHQKYLLSRCHTYMCIEKGDTHTQNLCQVPVTHYHQILSCCVRICQCGDWTQSSSNALRIRLMHEAYSYNHEAFISGTNA
jgi:hypothetical protein